jgi:hypothetical protein
MDINRIISIVDLIIWYYEYKKQTGYVSRYEVVYGGFSCDCVFCV